MKTRPSNMILRGPRTTESEDRAIEVNHIALSNSTKVTGGFIGVMI
jgi:hypothetical protein